MHKLPILIYNVQPPTTTFVPLSHVSYVTSFVTTPIYPGILSCKMSTPITEHMKVAIRLMHQY